MKALLAALAFACVAHPLGLSRDALRSLKFSLADERPGPRHVKWLQQIDVRRVPESAR